MSMNAFARVSFYALLSCAWACGGTESSGPGPVKQPPPLILTANFFWTHSRITTPGKIWFGVMANKAVARVELHNGSIKVAETAPAADTAVIAASVTAADNGTQTYLVKAYDAGGSVAESALISVVVDIRWSLTQIVVPAYGGSSPVIATDANNSIYYASTTAAPSYDMRVVKYDVEGQELWTRTFGGPDSEFTRSIAIGGSGRVYVAGTLWGRTQTVGTEAKQCLVNIYDAGGDLLATRQVKPTSMDRTSGCMAAADASNNLYVIGYGINSTRGWWPFAVKYDGDGNLLWNREISATPVPGSQLSNTELTAVAIDALGSGIYIGGSTAGATFDGAPNRGPRDLFVLKLDADGNTLWGRQYGTAGLLTMPNQLTADPNGGVYLAGLTAVQNEADGENALIASYAADGTLRWVRMVDGGWPDRGVQIAVNSRGVYLAGWTYGARFSGREISEMSQVTFRPGSALYEAYPDIFVARFSVTGGLQAVRMLGTQSVDAPIGIVTAGNGDVYVAGNLGASPLLARLQDAP